MNEVYLKVYLKYTTHTLFSVRGTIKLPYVIMYMYQNFDIPCVHGQIPKSIYHEL